MTKLFNKKLNERKEKRETIEERNLRVDSNKAWETSNLRKLLIAIITYIVIAVYMAAIEFITLGPSWAIMPVIPTLGYLISTTGLNFIANRWKKKWRENLKLEG